MAVRRQYGRRNQALDLDGEREFLNNIKSSLTSPSSRAGPINCKTGSHLQPFLEAHFHNASRFSMNDEMPHTGYSKMVHCLIVWAVKK
jgi:hypothetical protein